MMANAPRFDVYVIGAKDNSPPAQMRLAGTIAARYRLAAPVVAEALEGIPCRVAEKQERGQAEALAAALESLGAVVRLSPAGVSLAVPGRKDHRITLKSADVETPLLVDVSEAIDFAEPGPDAKTGVRGSDTARCHIHGLAYNRRKASGCVRCLADARARARKLQQELPATGVGERGGWASLRNNPVRRVFWGLAVALVVGFVPACYYALSINRRELDGLRAQQAALSDSRDSINRFDELDVAVEGAHRRGAGRTLLIWIAFGGLTAAAWTRLTRPSPLDGIESHLG